MSDYTVDAETRGAREMLAEVRRGLDLLEGVITDPRLPQALQSLDGSTDLDQARGAGFRAYLNSKGVEVPNDVMVDLGIPVGGHQESSDSSTPHYTSYCFHYWHAEATGEVTHHQVGVHHDSTGWHWGC